MTNCVDQDDTIYTCTNSSQVMNPSLLRSILLNANSTLSSSGMTEVFLQQQRRPPVLWVGCGCCNENKMYFRIFYGIWEKVNWLNLILYYWFISSGKYNFTHLSGFTDTDSQTFLCINIKNKFCLSLIESKQRWTFLWQSFPISYGITE